MSQALHKHQFPVTKITRAEDIVYLDTTRHIILSSHHHEQLICLRTSGASEDNLYDVSRGLEDLFGIMRGIAPRRRGVTASQTHTRKYGHS